MSGSDGQFDHLYDNYGINRQYDDPDAVTDKYPPDWNHRQAAIINYHNERCARCRRPIGSDPGSYDFHVHHIIPLHKRGTHHLDNLVPLCVHCHALMHPDNDRLDDWREAPLFPAGSADRRVAVERLPQSDFDRAVYDDRSSPADFEQDGEVNVYARSAATTGVPAHVAVSKDNPSEEDSERLSLGDNDLFCSGCSTLVLDGSGRCDACGEEREFPLVYIGVVVAVVLVALVVAVLLFAS